MKTKRPKPETGTAGKSFLMQAIHRRADKVKPETYLTLMEKPQNVRRIRLRGRK